MLVSFFSTDQSSFSPSSPPAAMANWRTRPKKVKEFHLDGESFIGAVTGQPVEDRLLGTCATVAAVIYAGADAVRVHDVGALRPAIQVADAIRRGLQEVTL